MQKHTHLAFGVCLGMAPLFFQEQWAVGDSLALYGAGVLIGSLLPDIDHPRSSLGRKLPILSVLVSLIFKHRTFFHSLLFLALIWLTNYWLPDPLIFGLLIGVSSHLIGDMMTHQGIQLFYPLDRYVSFPVTFKTGGVIEHLLFLVFSFISVYVGVEVYRLL